LGKGSESVYSLSDGVRKWIGPFLWRDRFYAKLRKNALAHMGVKKNGGQSVEL